MASKHYVLRCQSDEPKGFCCIRFNELVEVELSIKFTVLEKKKKKKN